MPLGYFREQIEGTMVGMDANNSIEADRLAALEAEVNRLRAENERLRQPPAEDLLTVIDRMWREGLKETRRS